jgi:hypothetical protein
MSFIEELRNSLTRMMDGEYKPQHASDVTTEQKQKWYDDRARAFLKNYEREVIDGDKFNTKPGKNSDAGYWLGNSTQSDDALSPGAIGEYNSSPYVYEFTYTAPKNGHTIDDGESEYRKGLVYTIPVKPGDNGNWSGGLPYGKQYIYEAILDDGTTLNADQFRDFVTANTSMFGSDGFRLGRNLWKSQKRGDANKNEALDFYNRKKQEYINALPEERNPYAYRSTWDRFRRGWDSH